MEMTMNGRVCAIVDTKYQLLNCLNIVFHMSKNKNIDFDLYMSRSSFFTEEMVNRLEDTGLFRNIYLYKDINDSVTMGHPFLNNWVRFKRVFAPRRFIIDMCYDKTCLKKGEYKYLLCAFNTHIAMAFSMAYSDIKILLFEEGTASYTNNILPVTRNRDILFNLMNKRNPWKEIGVIFVNNEKYYLKGIAKKTVQLPSLKNAPTELLQMLQNVFCYKGSKLYNEEKFVYLLQPFSAREQDERHNVQKSIIKILEREIPSCILRRHPKQEVDYETSLQYDNDNDMWELICGQRIHDSHVIIGAFSTAQITPKLIFDEEPWLIFTYRIYKDWLGKEHMEGIEKMAMKLISNYRIPEKIMNVDSLEDFEKALIIMKNKRNVQQSKKDDDKEY